MSVLGMSPLYCKCCACAVYNNLLWNIICGCNICELVFVAEATQWVHAWPTANYSMDYFPMLGTLNSHCMVCQPRICMSLY